MTLVALAHLAPAPHAHPEDALWAVLGVLAALGLGAVVRLARRA